MPWSTPVEYPLGCAEMEWCQHPGCLFGAVVRFTSVLDAVDRQDKRIRSTTRCAVHAEHLRAEISKRAVVLPPPVEAEPVDDSRRMHAITPALPKKAPQIFDIPSSANVTTCRSCGESIAFVLTRAEKLIPVEVFGDHRGEAHFIRCPKANEHRKRA